MLSIRNKKIEGHLFQNLFMYLYRRCDVITFSLPMFHDMVATKENYMMYKNKPIGYRKKYDDAEFLNYMEDISEFLEDIEPYIVDEFESTVYCDSIRAYNSRVRVVSFLEDVIGDFSSGQNLYRWQYPECVEDLCFYSKGKCFLRSIAHEGLCEIYTDDEVEIRLLKKMGLKMSILDHREEDIPTLHYTLSY